MNRTTSKKINIALAGSFMVLFYFIIPINLPAQDIPSSEAFLKKYTLTESFEVGMEFSYMIPNSNKTNNMGNPARRKNSVPDKPASCMA